MFTTQWNFPLVCGWNTNCFVELFFVPTCSEHFLPSILQQKPTATCLQTGHCVPVWSELHNAGSNWGNLSTVIVCIMQSCSSEHLFEHFNTFGKSPCNTNKQTKVEKPSLTKSHIKEGFIAPKGPIVKRPRQTMRSLLKNVRASVCLMCLMSVSVWCLSRKMCPTHHPCSTIPLHPIHPHHARCSNRSWGATSPCGCNLVEQKVK